MLGFIWSETGSHWWVLSREGRGSDLCYVKDLSGGSEDLGLWRGQAGSKETSQEATRGDNYMVGMAGMVTMEVARDGFLVFCGFGG